MNWQVIGTYFLDRMKERTTWLSLGTALTGMGVIIAPEKWNLIMAIGMGVPGMISAFLPPHIDEKSITPAPPEAPTTPLAQSLADKVQSGQTDPKT
jgi:hypothetical protein